MRKLKKFKRFDKGGLTDSSGNPVLSGDGTPIQTMEDTETPDEKYAKRREGFESIKDFFMGRRSKNEPSAPIEERQPPKKAAEEDKAPAKPAETKPVESGRGKITSTSTMTEEESRADSDKGAAPSSSTTTGNAKKAEAYRQSLMPVNKPKPKPKPKPPAPAAEKTPAASSKPSYVGAGDSDDSVDTKKKNELERLKRVGSGAVEQTMMGPVETIALGASKLPAMARTGLGRMFKSATKPEGKGTGKFPEAKPEIQVSTKPAVDRLKEANIQGPSKPPRQETPAEKMGVRETSAMEKTRKANEVGPPDLGARARRVAEDAAKDTKQGEEVMAAAGRRATQNRADQKQAADVMAAANKRARDNRADQKQAADVMAAAGARAKQNRAENKQASDVMAAAKKRANTNRAQQRSDKIPQKDREPGYMQEYIAGREAARNRIKDLPDDGLSTPRYEMKKGGKIPAFKKGGFVSRGDGCAQRGKTKGRMM